jgi:hypothetical protein
VPIEVLAADIIKRLPADKGELFRWRVEERARMMAEDGLLGLRCICQGHSIEYLLALLYGCAWRNRVMGPAYACLRRHLARHLVVSSG